MLKKIKLFSILFVGLGACTINSIQSTEDSSNKKVELSKKSSRNLSYSVSLKNPFDKPTPTASPSESN